MAMIKKKSIENLKDTVRLSDVFEWLGARVERRGKQVMAFCPFCEDAQSRSPACSIRDDIGMFHCFAAGTLVETDQGTRPIETLVNTDRVSIRNGNGAWEKAKFSSYGVQRLWHIRIMSEGVQSDLYATALHRWFVWNDDKLVEKTTRELLSGDQIARVGENGTYSDPHCLVAFSYETDRVEEVWCCQTSTGSFALADEILTGNCFRCQESGDAITAVMLHEEVNFPEAIEMIADKFDVKLEYEASADPEAESRRKKLVGILEDAQGMFVDQRSDSHFGQFLEQRNITMDTAENFGLGLSLYAKADKVIAKLREKYSDQDIVDSGLAYMDDRTGSLVLRFKNRLMFPIRTASGTLVGFAGRDLTGKSPAKYKNSPENDLFKKRDLLYGMDIAKKAMARAKRVIVCEGQMDTIALQDHGFPYAVGAMGTALTTQNLKRLSTFADTIYISLDSDSAGIAAAMRTAETMPYSFHADVRVVTIPNVICHNEEEVRKVSPNKAKEYLFETRTLPDGSTEQIPVQFPVAVPMAKDPDEFFNQEGHTTEEFEEIIGNAQDLFLFCAAKAIEPFVEQLEREVAKEAPDTVAVAQAKMEGRRAVDDLMAKIYHKANIYQRQNIANLVITKMRLIDTADALEQAWAQRAKTSQSAAMVEKARESMQIDPLKEMGLIESELTGEEDLLIATLYFHPKVRQTVWNNIEDIDRVFTSPVRRSIFQKLDEGYGKGFTAKQATDKLMDTDEIKEIGRIVMSFDAAEEAKRELSDETIVDICRKIQRHAIENSIELESQAATPDVMKIIELKMALAKFDD